MNHWLEILLGLDHGWLSQSGEWSIQFHPDWPFQQAMESVGGAAFYNVVLAIIAAILVVYVYRREGRTRRARVFLGTMRLLLAAMVLILLNRPTLVLEQERREPSVVAVLVDDTISMSVPDMGSSTAPITRLAAVQDLLAGPDSSLLRDLAKVHDLRIYRFGKDAQQVASIINPENPTTQPADQLAQAAAGIRTIAPTEDGTLVAQSLHTVLDELQGQHVAGVVLLTDGRDTPIRERPEIINDIRSRFGVPIYPVAVGQDQMPRTLEVLRPDYESAAFVDDYTVIKADIRSAGYEPGHPVHIVLLNKKDGHPIVEKGHPVEATVNLDADGHARAELSFMPAHVLGLDEHNLPNTLPPEDRSLQLVVQVEKQPGQINTEGTSRDVSVEVLDTQIHLLIVDGYPRWEYRYLKNTLIRDKTMKVSCLLTSADPNFVQDSSSDVTPIIAFPSTMQRLMDYDVVIFGDVDQHQFTDAQLQLINDFVSKRGGGFAMVAGPRYAPQSFKNTPIQPILPVDISKTASDDSSIPITEGFDIRVTPDGRDTSVFRLFGLAPDETIDNPHIPLFWYCHNIVPLPESTVWAEHPTDTIPGSSRHAPILVVSQFGAGRTLFSAIDDSWRWRFYTGETIYTSYWVQQIRYLARNRKLDQRTVVFEPLRQEYQIGDQAGLDLTVLSPQLAQELSPTIPVDILDEHGQPVKRVTLARTDNPQHYVASWTADTIGRFTARLPALGDSQPVDRPYVITVPRLELEQPQVDRSFLSSLGAPIPFDRASADLPGMIHSAAKTIPRDYPKPLWSMPLVLGLFTLLLTAEWIGRKLCGMP